MLLRIYLVKRSLTAIILVQSLIKRTAECVIPRQEHTGCVGVNLTRSLEVATMLTQIDLTRVRFQLLVVSAHRRFRFLRC